MRLYVGNINYSSWSMCSWVLLADSGLPFEEVLVHVDSFDAGSRFKLTMAAVSPTGKVPVLVDGDLVVWDTLAIAEYVAEKAQSIGRSLWPVDAARRARARSLCAEMHSGFTALRRHCPMNIEASLPEIGARLLAEQPDVWADLDRLIALWRSELQAHGGPWLFGANFSVADSYFAPLVMCLKTYALPVPADVEAYLERVCERASVAAWIGGALAEQDFLGFEYPNQLVC